MKQKRQIGILLVLILAAALVWAWNFRSKAVTADASPNLQEPATIIDVENPHIRMEQIERARSAEYKGSGRNPFSPAAAAPAPVAKTTKPANEFKKYGPEPPPPPPPPLPCVLPANVKFYGFGTVPNGTSRRAFLHDGEDVHVLGEGDVLLKRFRIIRISNANLEFEEISRGCIGTAPLVEEPAGGPGSPGAPGGLPQ